MHVNGDHPSCSSPAIAMHQPGPKESLLNVVARIMDKPLDRPVWVDYVEAMFSHINVLSVERLKSKTYEVTTDGSYKSKMRGDPGTIHFPKRLVIRFNRKESRIEFVGNSIREPTGLRGSGSFMGIKGYGAVKWIQYLPESSTLYTYTETDSILKPRDHHYCDYQESCNRWHQRVWLEDK